MRKTVFSTNSPAALARHGLFDAWARFILATDERFKAITDVAGCGLLRVSAGCSPLDSITRRNDVSPLLLTMSVSNREAENLYSSRAVWITVGIALYPNSKTGIVIGIVKDGDNCPPSPREYEGDLKSVIEHILDETLDRFARRPK